jgi:peptidoglycan hydrolase-like protein with peptidoglycan-binding domain
MALLQAAVLALSLHGLAAAEGPIYAVQDALKREQFFSGERTGVLDQPTRNALQRFQTRHGLPDTGEIDTATLQALQSSAEVGRPVIESQTSATKDSALSDDIVQKDREFLRKLKTAEAGREQNVPAPSELSASSALSQPAPAADPAPVQASEPVQSLPPVPDPTSAVVPEVAPPSPPPVQPTAAAPSDPDTSVQPSREAEVAKSRPVEKRRPHTSRKVEQPIREYGSDSPAHQQPELDPIANAPQRRAETRIPPANSKVVVNEDNWEPLDSGGVRITRSTTRVTGPDGRTYTKTTTYPGTVPVRRAEPVEPRRKKDGFFDRLFKDD